jgi:hypothetical protein
MPQGKIGLEEIGEAGSASLLESILVSGFKCLECSTGREESWAHRIDGNADFQKCGTSIPQLGDEEPADFRTMRLCHGCGPLNFWQIGGDVMSYMRERKRSRLPPVGETRLGVARLAERVCEATRQAALEGVRSALSIAAEQSPALPEEIRHIADQALARVAIMQTEMDRFLAASRGRHGARKTPSTTRDKTAVCVAAMFGGPRGQATYK